MKKRMLSMVLACFMAISLTACGSKPETAATGSASESISVEKKILTTELTIPASYIDDAEKSVKEAEKKGYTAKANADGSITYTLTKSQHSKLMEDMQKSLEDSVQEIIDSGDYSSLKNIQFNDDFTKATVTVDYEKFDNSFDIMSLYTVAFIAPMYQAYNGTASDDIKAEISIVDEESGETKDTMNYPEDFGDIVNSESTEKSTSDFDGTGYEDTGDGTMYVVTPSGSSESGEVPVLFVAPDEWTQIELDAWEFDGSHLSYIYIDGTEVQTEQLSDSQVTVNLDRPQLTAGTHKVEVVQYDNDKSDGEVIVYKTTEYEVKEK